MAEGRCPLIENCQQKTAVCNVQLPDESCYWFRWFRALDNPWHTGKPTEEGWYLLKLNHAGRTIYDANYLWDIGFGMEWKYAYLGEIVEWQKIEEGEVTNGTDN